MRNMLPYREQQRSEHEPTRRRGRRAAGGALHDRRLPELPALHLGGPGSREQREETPSSNRGQQATLPVHKCFNTPGSRDV